MNFSVSTLLILIGLVLLALAIFGPRLLTAVEANAPAPLGHEAAVGANGSAPEPASTDREPAPAIALDERPRWPQLVAPAAVDCDAAARIDLADALGALDSEWARSVLRQALDDETDADVRAVIAAAFTSASQSEVT